MIKGTHIGSLHPFEVELHITDTGRAGVWANMVAVKGRKPVRNAGQLPAGDATSHTQSAVALTAALHGITHRQARQLADFNGVAKPRLRITVLNKTFARAISDRITMKADGERLRTASAIVAVLLDRLRWYEVTWRSRPEDPDLLALQAWSRQQIHAPKEIRKIPSTFVPDAVSMIG